MQSFSPKQMALLIVVLLIGSAPLFELTARVKQDAWLAVLLAAIAGLLLTVLYMRIQRRAPDAALAELYKLHFGRWVGGAIALGYVALFAYESMLNVRNVGKLATAALLPPAPQWIIMLLIVAAAAYTVHKGVEVFVRVVQLLFPILAISYLVIIILWFGNGLVKLDRMLPVMESGIKNIAQFSFPSLLTIPFGQMVVMLVFWKYVMEKQLVGRVTYMALVGASLFLAAVPVLIVTVLGPELAAATVLPFLHAVQLIQLTNFIERFDMLVALLLFIGLYTKITLFYTASVFTWNAVLGVANGYSILPIGAIIYAASCIDAIDHSARLGISIMSPLLLLFQVALPLIMLLIGVRKRYKPA